MKRLLFALLTVMPLQALSVVMEDPFSAQQWAIHNQGRWQSVELDYMVTRWVPSRIGEDLHMPLLTPKKKIIVAVLDTGVDKNHPDLKGRLYRKPSECAALEKFQKCVEEKTAEKETNHDEAANPRLQCEKIWFDLN